MGGSELGWVGLSTVLRTHGGPVRLDFGDNGEDRLKIPLKWTRAREHSLPAWGNGDPGGDIGTSPSPVPTPAGNQMYRRSVVFLLAMACYALWPGRRLTVEHAFGLEDTSAMTGALPSDHYTLRHTGREQ